MASATVTSKGQITIPIQIRTQLGLAAGDRVDFIIDVNGRVSFLPITTSVTALRGMVPKPAKAVSLRDMKASIKGRDSRT